MYICSPEIGNFQYTVAKLKFSIRDAGKMVAKFEFLYKEYSIISGVLVIYSQTRSLFMYNVQVQKNVHQDGIDLNHFSVHNCHLWLY